MVVANPPHRRVIAGRRDQGAGGHPADRLEDEGEHGFRPFGPDPFVQRGGGGFGVADGVMACRRPVGQRRRHFRHGLGERAEDLAGGGVTAGGEGAQGVAVVGRLTPDHFPARPLADRDLVLAGEFNRRLDRLRTAGGRKHPLEAGTGEASQEIGHGAVGAAFEMTETGEGGGRRLGVQSGQHAGVAMAQIAGDRPRTGVEIAFAGAIPHIHPSARAISGLGGALGRAEDMHRLAAGA